MKVKESVNNKSDNKQLSIDSNSEVEYNPTYTSHPVFWGKSQTGTKTSGLGLVQTRSQLDWDQLPQH